MTVKWTPGTGTNMDLDTALAEALDLAVGSLDDEADEGDDIGLASLVGVPVRSVSRSAI